MKKKKSSLISCLLCLCAVCFWTFYSCERQESEVVDFGNLSENGEFFVTKLKQRPGWEKEWESLRELGEPSVNQATVAMGGGQGWFLVLPLLDGKEMAGMVVYPFKEGDETTTLSSLPLVDPLVLDRQGIDTTLCARGFIRSDAFKQWQTDGLVFDVESLSPFMPPRPTKPPQMATTRGEYRIPTEMSYIITQAYNIPVSFYDAICEASLAESFVWDKFLLAIDEYRKPHSYESLDFEIVYCNRFTLDLYCYPYSQFVDPEFEMDYFQKIAQHIFALYGWYIDFYGIHWVYQSDEWNPGSVGDGSSYWPMGNSTVGGGEGGNGIEDGTSPEEAIAIRDTVAKKINEKLRKNCGFAEILTDIRGLSQLTGGIVLNDSYTGSYVPDLRQIQQTPSYYEVFINNITYESFFEEIIHFMQDMVYDNGIGDLISTARTNIEFEAKLVHDLYFYNQKKSKRTNSYLVLQRINEEYIKEKEYEDLLKEISDGKLKTENYFNMVDKFSTYTPYNQYKDKIDRSVLPMIVLKYGQLFSSNKCE
jgi:hypothetical protein